MIYITAGICIAGFFLLLTVFSYSIFKNLRSNLNGADFNYLPNTALFVPCKNFFASLESNLESVSDQDYKGKYRIIYIVESKNDEAYPVIEKILKKSKNAELVIAGTAVNNSQKNFNILKAIEKFDKEKRNDFEVYAFFDSDHFAPKNWLTTLIAALTVNNTEMSTFHSVKNPKSLFPLGNIIYSMLHNYIYGVNTFSNQAWGGSLAMRKTTYKKYNIGKIWDSAVSHDCPMNGIKAKISFYPHCMPEETHYHYTLKSFIKWSTRQFTNWKHYSLNFWYLSFFSILANVLIIYAFIISVLHNYFFKSNNTVTLVIGIYIILSHILLSVFISFKMKRKILWFILNIFLIPLFLNTLIISFLASINNNNINWAGKNYSITKSGAVLEIKNITNN